MTDSEHNIELQKRMLAGDPTAKEEMIRFNLPFVERLVAYHLGRNPKNMWLEDDLLSDASLKLWHVVEQLAIRKPSANTNANPSGYIQTAVERSILDTIAANPIRVKQGLVDWSAVTDDEADDFEADDFDADDGVPDDAPTTLERLLSNIYCPRTQEIVRLRARGLTMRKIADAVGWSPATVCRRLKEVNAVL
jgi:RNA polymerase sigma factor (sigma-70 family)